MIEKRLSSGSVIFNIVRKGYERETGATQAHVPCKILKARLHNDVGGFISI